MYLVKYSRGSWDDYAEHTKFVTEDLEIAKNYVDKFNTTIEKFKSFYRERYPEGCESDTNDWIDHLNLVELNEAYYTEIEVR